MVIGATSGMAVSFFITLYPGFPVNFKKFIDS